MTSRPEDVAAVRAVVETFLGAFVDGPDSVDRLDALRALFVPGAIVVATCGRPEPAVYDVDGFITPRQELLAGGSLTEFTEWPESGRVEMFGDIAHWFGSYSKSGTQDGEAFTGRGMKSMQLVRFPEGWRISAIAWDDEREGLTIDQP
ncbi:Cif family virulence factor [Luteipulveratus flavus]|uniref:DUF4440 domain-containing protein n=1 Tax=Luteipulveratus flavus TaxID=3031728 RepID=A0ABT6C891_9MICO|nr:DUF4440 domain-containing protein [Luteipulveratus sp. YIM 133296]MDF8264507.1 DUF4440 domain-containing protein [Luteipulveratus sp. YIM 133296]